MLQKSPPGFGRRVQSRPAKARASLRRQMVEQSYGDVGGLGGGLGGGGGGEPAAQITPASSLCSQLLVPQSWCAHDEMYETPPWPASPSGQLTSSSQMGPDPSPKNRASTSRPLTDMPPPWPSCRQTVCASAAPHPSSQMVPQTPAWKISTRPSVGWSPPISRSCPSDCGDEGGRGGGPGGFGERLPMHRTPTSSLWPQLLTLQGWWLHSSSRPSLLRQATSSSQMGPVPRP